MFDRLMRLYKAGKLSEESLRNAINRNWITEEEYQQIINL